MSDRNDIKGMDGYRASMDSIRASDEFISRTEQRMREIRDKGDISPASRPKLMRFMPYMAAAAACAVIAVAFGSGLGTQDIATNSIPDVKKEEVDSFVAEVSSVTVSDEAEMDEDIMAGGALPVDDLPEEEHDTHVYGELVVSDEAADDDVEEAEAEVGETVLETVSEKAPEPSPSLAENAVTVVSQPKTVQPPKETAAPVVETVTETAPPKEVRKSKPTEATVSEKPVTAAEKPAEPTEEPEGIPAETPENGLDMDAAVRRDGAAAGETAPAEEVRTKAAAAVAAPSEEAAPENSAEAEPIFSPRLVWSVFEGHDITITDGHGRKDTYSGDYADSLLRTLTGATEMTAIGHTPPADPEYTVKTVVDGIECCIYVGTDTVTYETEDENGKVYITYRLISAPSWSAVPEEGFIPETALPVETSVTSVTVTSAAVTGSDTVPTLPVHN